MDRLFDEAARILAGPVPRRKVFTLILGAAMAVFSRPLLAVGRHGTCSGSGQGNCDPGLTCFNCGGNNRRCVAAGEGCCGGSTPTFCPRPGCCCSSTGTCSSSLGADCTNAGCTAL